MTTKDVSITQKIARIATAIVYKTLISLHSRYWDLADLSYDASTGVIEIDPQEELSQEEQAYITGALEEKWTSMPALLLALLLITIFISVSVISDLEAILWAFLLFLVWSFNHMDLSVQFDDEDRDKNIGDTNGT